MTAAAPGRGAARRCSRRSRSARIGDAAGRRRGGALPGRRRRGLHHRAGAARQRRAVHVAAPHARGDSRRQMTMAKSVEEQGQGDHLRAARGRRRSRSRRRRRSSRTSGADSLAIVELVMALEEEFEIEIPDEDTEKIKTVGDAVELHQGAQAVGARDGGEPVKRQRRVVITGIGLVTPVGNTPRRPGRRCSRASPASARSRRSTPRSFATRIAGEVKDFDPAQVHRQEDADEARPLPPVRGGRGDDGGGGRRPRASSQVDRTRVGVLVGSGIGGIETLLEHSTRRCSRRGRDRVSPFFIPMIIVNMAAGHDLDPLRRQGPELRRGHGLRDRRPRHRRGAAASSSAATPTS